MRLISFLGTTPYLPIHYSFGTRTKQPRKFVQTAIVEITSDTGSDVVILATDAAQKKHENDLRAELGSLNNSPEIKLLSIPDGHSEDELWFVFEKIGEALNGAKKVVVDITHGFRSLPATGVLALSFYQQLTQSSIELRYGAFEGMTNQDGTRLNLPRDQSVFKYFESLSSQERDAFTAPILDLTPMFTLPGWAEAISEWRRTGRARGLVEQTKPHTDSISKDLKSERPKSLTDLPKALALLDDSLTLVRHDKIAECASEVVRLANAARQEAERHPKLRPLIQLMQQLKESVNDLVADNIDHEDLSDSYLRNQVAAAQWQAKHGRVMEAYSLLRETITSCAVRIARAAKIESITVPTDDGPKECHYDASKFRTELDGLLAILSGAMPGNPRDYVKNEAKCIRESLDIQPSAMQAYCAAYGAVQIARNKLDHCWTGEHSSQVFTRGTAEGVKNNLLVAIASVNALVSLLCDKSEQPATPVRSKSAFLNLSNHPIAAWSTVQIEAAKALGFGDPGDFPIGLVDPHATADEVFEFATTLAKQVETKGYRAAFVSGDFTFTYALVTALRARGVRCFAATTERVSSEMQIEGKTLISKEFQFVAWREYL